MKNIRDIYRSLEEARGDAKGPVPLPVMLILRREGLRSIGKRNIGLYYSDQLDRYVTLTDKVIKLEENWNKTSPELVQIQEDLQAFVTYFEQDKISLEEMMDVLEDYKIHDPSGLITERNPRSRALSAIAASNKPKKPKEPKKPKTSTTQTTSATQPAAKVDRNPQRDVRPNATINPRTNAQTAQQQSAKRPLQQNPLAAAQEKAAVERQRLRNTPKPGVRPTTPVTQTQYKQSPKKPTTRSPEESPTTQSKFMKPTTPADKAAAEKIGQGASDRAKAANRKSIENARKAAAEQAKKAQGGNGGKKPPPNPPKGQSAADKPTPKSNSVNSV